jgi:uncharacterized protein (DUF1501 family)
MALNRRDVLRAGVIGGLSMGAFGWLARAAAARTRVGRGPAPGAEKVVVVVTLNGGNDGLNTVVPLRQFDRYRSLRPSIAIARQRLLPIPGLEADFAFNPGLGAFRRLYAEGRLAVVNGVGAPRDAQGLFDHAASLQNLNSGTTYGAAPASLPTGWLGRYLDGLEPASLPRGVTFGSGKTLLTGRQTTPLVLSSLAGLGIYPSDDAEARLDAYRRLQEGTAAAGAAESNRQLRQQMITLGVDLGDIGSSYLAAPGVTYPAYNDVGSALRDCAALIATGRGVRALEVTQPGFDTHVAQQVGPPDTTRYHERLCSIFAGAIGAFQADLDGHGLSDRVVTLVCSEFGRRPMDNSEYGTDHGLAGPMFVIGGPVRGGIYGDYPDLRDEHLVLDGNLDVSVDFRSVYATLLANHLGVDPGPILGADFEPLGFL